MQERKRERMREVRRQRERKVDQVLKFILQPAAQHAHFEVLLKDVTDREIEIEVKESKRDIFLSLLLLP